jgi:quinol-cytochrome oxidoreductase complex cytochrome b subunit
MTKNQLHAMYRDSSAQDRSTYNRWLAANAIAGSILIAAMIVMALLGSQAPEPRQATASSTQAVDVSK